MNWALHHVGLSAQDIARARWFFGELIGLSGTGSRDTESEVRTRFGSEGRGLHLSKPRRAVGSSGGQIVRPAGGRHLAITVKDLNAVASNLDRASISYVETPGDTQSITTLDPSLNLIEFHQAQAEGDTDGSHPWEQDWGWGVHHVNLQVADVREGVAFFTEMAGMPEGPWHVPETMGDVSIDPAQLALLPLADDNRGLHLNRPDATFALRKGFAHNPTIGGHPAFWVADIKAVMQRFDEAGVLYTDAGVYAMPHMHQIYVLDLTANFIEVNQYV